MCGRAWAIVCRSQGCVCLLPYADIKGMCCVTASEGFKQTTLQGHSLSRKVNNSMWIQEIPKTNQVHYAPPCQSKQ